jgi:hypothetical protein
MGVVKVLDSPMADTGTGGGTCPTKLSSPPRVVRRPATGDPVDRLT